LVSPAQIREHYDSLAFVYRTFWGDHIHHGLFIDGDGQPEAAQVRMVEQCAQWLNLQGGERVLDAGCGHGGTLVHLARHMGCTGVGLTISPKQVRLAREQAGHARLHDRLVFVEGDVVDFPFSRGEFHVVWVMESSEHFADKAKFVRDAYSSLIPGGQLLLAAWTGSMASPRVRAVARAFLCPELWTAEEYAEGIESAGMSVTRRVDLSAQVMHTWEICQQRAQAASAVIRLLPWAAREFVAGIDIILEAYRAGDLRYTVLVGRK
jgi:tocopherol O-methyltransferase